MSSSVLFLLIAVFICQVNGIRKLYPIGNAVMIIDKDNVGTPVFVTPFIEKGQIQQGRDACKVPPIKDDVKSYSGFITVNKRFNSNLFFWYFPAENLTATAPVVLWLQGGPGVSSMFGVFEEHGPFYVKIKRGLKMREHYLSQIAHMLYIDSPVGTGYSFTNDPAGYAKNLADVATNLQIALVQFFKLFPELKNNDFYIAGDSYGGKFVVATAYNIDNTNPRTPQKINLKGIAIGNAMIDPENMMNYSPYFYKIGLIDQAGKRDFDPKQKDIVNHIKAKRFIKAWAAYDQLMIGESADSTFTNLTGFNYLFNLLDQTYISPHGDYRRYVQKDIMRRSLHIGNLTFYDDSKVEDAMRRDIMDSARPMLEKLLEKYRVLVYTGQLDLVVPYETTIDYLVNLQWSGSRAYNLASRTKWEVNGELAGYSKTASRLTELLVLGAGHVVYRDQPFFGFSMIQTFINNQPFFSNERKNPDW